MTLRRFTHAQGFLETRRDLPELFRCDWRIASCYMHLGKPQDAREIFERWTGRATESWGIIDTEGYANLFDSYGVCLQHLQPIPEQTERTLRDVLDEIEYYRAPCLERDRVSATLGNLPIRKGHFEEAEGFLLEAYGLVDREEKPKHCTFLGHPTATSIFDS